MLNQNEPEDSRFDDPQKIVNMHAFLLRTGLSRRTVCRMMAAGTAPARVQLSPGRFGFIGVDQWIESRTQARG